MRNYSSVPEWGLCLRPEYVIQERIFSSLKEVPGRNTSTCTVICRSDAFLPPPVDALRTSFSFRLTHFWSLSFASNFFQSESDMLSVMIGPSRRSGRSKINWVANDEENLEDLRSLCVYKVQHRTEKHLRFVIFFVAFHLKAKNERTNFWRRKQLTGWRNIVYHKETRSQSTTMSVLGTQLQTAELNLMPFKAVLTRHFVG